MKTNLFLISLLLGIGTSFAQTKPSIKSHLGYSKYAEASGSFYARHKFSYGYNGNAVNILVDRSERFLPVSNLDSILRLVKHDVELFQDSLVNDGSNYRMDVTLQPNTMRKIAITKSYSNTRDYVVNQENAAIVKPNLDTLNILAHIDFEGATGRNDLVTIQFLLKNILDPFPFNSTQLNAISVAVENGLQDPKEKKNYRFTKYADLAEKQGPIQNQSRWNGESVDHSFSIGVMPSIQNYKNYFAPSLSLNAMFTFGELSELGKKYRNSVGLGWEPFFFFEKDANGATKTKMNSFLSFYASGGSYTKSDRLGLSENFSLGYLIGRKGNFMDKHTWRIATLGLHYKQVDLQPQFFFHGFLKGIQPSIRLSVAL